MERCKNCMARLVDIEHGSYNYETLICVNKGCIEFGNIQIHREISYSYKDFQGKWTTKGKQPMILVSVIRKGAFKRLIFTADYENYLALLQIFETTDDVVDYTVIELGKDFLRAVDIYKPNVQGFDKWKPVQ